jgi:hypothetical protein
MVVAGTMAKKLGTFPVTLLLAIHAKAIQSVVVAAPVKGFSKSSSERLEGCEEALGGGLGGGLQGGLVLAGGGGGFKPEFRASALGLDKQVLRTSSSISCSLRFPVLAPIPAHVYTYLY